MAARKKTKQNKIRVPQENVPAKTCCYNAFRILFLLVLAILGIIWFFWHLPTTGPRPVEPFLRNVQPSPTSQTNQVSKMRSSDGTMTLVMKTENLFQGNKTYTFSAVDNANQNEQLLYEKTVDAGTSITIPVNSWSPKNNYVFVKETAPDKLTFLVFQASGEAFAKGDRYFDIGALFVLKLPKYILTDATGWASDTLVIIKTNTEDGAKGPSFWFDLSSQSFLQLSR